MTSFLEQSLRRKLMLITMMTSGVALVVAAAAFLSSDVVTVRRDMVSDLHSLARVIGANCVAQLTFKDKNSAMDTLSALKARPSIVAAALYDQDNTRFAYYLQGNRKANTPPEKLPRVMAGFSSG